LKLQGELLEIEDVREKRDQVQQQDGHVGAQAADENGEQGDPEQAQFRGKIGFWFHDSLNLQ
jgi:hypothetical protein